MVGLVVQQLYFENGKVPFEDLIKSGKRILFINETIGRGANIITGDYSVGASGMMIENESLLTL